MSNKHDHTLDLALAQQRNREPLSAILADLPDEAEEFRPLLEISAILRDLPVEVPSKETMAADRAAFLIRMGQLPAPAVSNGRLNRLKGWMAQRLPWTLPVLRPRELNRMSAFLLKTALVLIMIAGSAGGTAVLASDSLPGGPLYPVKLLVEDTQLALADDVEQELNLQLEFIAERVQEMRRLALSDNPPDEAAVERVRRHLSQTFHLAARAADETMNGLLVRTLATIQRQEQILAEARAGAGNQAQTSLEATSALMAQARAEAEYGLQAGEAFRTRHQQPDDGSEDWGQFGPGPGECPDPESCGTGGGAFGPGPGACQDPAGCGPGEGGNGPGPGDCTQPGSCLQNQEQNRPGDCDQPGSCQQNQEQNQAQNGPGDCVDPAACQQNQEQHQEQNGPDDCAGPGGCQQNQEQNQAQNGSGDCADPAACQQSQEQNQEQNGSGECADPATCQQSQEQNQEQNGSGDSSGAEPGGDDPGPPPADNGNPDGSGVNGPGDGGGSGTGGNSDSGGDSGGGGSGGGDSGGGSGGAGGSGGGGGH